MVGPNLSELIQKKRDGVQLSPEDMHYFIQQMTTGKGEQYQIGAMLMAMYLRGLSVTETVSLTKAIVKSGENMKWDSSWEDLLIDRHSTGGCGDKVPLIFAPALAAVGFKVPMVCGRGLQITGGTIDKLESIRGFKAQLTEAEMKNSLEKAGCFIAGPSDKMATGEKEFSKVRNATGTVGSTPLVIASIISKKVAEGAKALVMDIKVGSGAFYSDVEKARELATQLINVSKYVGVQIRVALTKMDSPIGRCVGNALEVAEAIDCMKGIGPEDVMELITTLGGMALEMKHRVPNLEEGKAAIRRVLLNGEALECFRRMLTCQGVDEQDAARLCYADMWTVLPSVGNKKIMIIKAADSGILQKVDAMGIASACWHLGAGRNKPGDQLDHSVGIKLLHVQGEELQKGDSLMEVHYNTAKPEPSILRLLEDSLIISRDHGMTREPSVIEVVTT